MNAKQRVVVITGAAGNLGRAVAQVFAQHGDQLVLLDRDTASLAGAATAGSEEPMLLPCDLLDAAQVVQLAGQVLARFGRVDVLCNLAGGFRMGEAVHETADATWDFLFDLNARTVLHAARAFVPPMLERRRGSIVNVGAFAALKGGAQMGAYAASKAAVMRLTESMAAELRGRGLNVNCVMPTILDTPENRAAMPDADPGQWVAAGDLAKVIAFLCSDDARAIHGACIPVTGLS